jgi:predicted transcriptional regulator
MGDLGFQQLLGDAGFSHNTLRTHLASLERQGLIVKDKKPIKRRGKPVFAYSPLPKIRHKVALTITEPPNNRRQPNTPRIETPLQV